MQRSCRPCPYIYITRCTSPHSPPMLASSLRMSMRAKHGQRSFSILRRCRAASKISVELCSRTVAVGRKYVIVILPPWFFLLFGRFVPQFFKSLMRRRENYAGSMLRAAQSPLLSTLSKLTTYHAFSRFREGEHDEEYSVITWKCWGSQTGLSFDQDPPGVKPILKHASFLQCERLSILMILVKIYMLIY